MKHVNGMSKDIAAMELLGPNPAAMVEWMKQVVGQDVGRMEAGLPSQTTPASLLPNSQAKAGEAYFAKACASCHSDGGHDGILAARAEVDAAHRRLVEREGTRPTVPGAAAVGPVAVTRR